MAGQVHSRTLPHAGDMESGDSAEHASSISHFQTIQQLVYVAAITAFSGLLAGEPAQCQW